MTKIIPWLPSDSNESCRDGRAKPYDRVKVKVFKVIENLNNSRERIYLVRVGAYSESGGKRSLSDDGNSWDHPDDIAMLSMGVKKMDLAEACEIVSDITDRWVAAKKSLSEGFNSYLIQGADHCNDGGYSEFGNLFDMDTLAKMASKSKILRLSEVAEGSVKVRIPEGVDVKPLIGFYIFQYRWVNHGNMKNPDWGWVYDTYRTSDNPELSIHFMKAGKYGDRIGRVGMEYQGAKDFDFPEDLVDTYLQGVFDKLEGEA